MGQFKMKKLKCQICPSTFTTKKYLNRHVKKVHGEKKLICEQCNYRTNFKQNFLRHLKTHEIKHSFPSQRKSEKGYLCDKCGLQFNGKQTLKKHEKFTHSSSNKKEKAVLSKENCNDFQECLSKKLIMKSWKHNGSKDIFYVLEKYKNKIRAYCAYFMKKEKGIKFSITIKVQLKKFNDDTTAEVFFCGKMRRLINLYEFKAMFNQSKEKIWQNCEAWLKEGSGWIVDKIKQLDLKICSYKPYRGSSYIESPDWVKFSRSVVNIKNTDDKCFLWHVAAAVFPVHLDPCSRVHYEKHLKKFNVKGIRWPMDIRQIDKFERQNNLSINVYKCENRKKDVWPIRISKKRDVEPINLLLLENDERSHFTLIRNFDRLLCDGMNGRTFCFYCLHGFVKKHTNKQKMAEHMETCHLFGGQKIRLPETGKNFVEFSNFPRMLKLPFIIYSDFECLNIKSSAEDVNSKTTKLTSHHVSGYAYCVLSPYKETKFFKYRGADAGEKFLQRMKEETKEILDWMKKNVKGMKPLSSSEEKRYRNSQECHICREKILEDKNRNSLNHLTKIEHWLQGVRMDSKKLPTITAIKKQKAKILLELHPDKNEGSEEQCKEAISIFQSLMGYYQKNSELLLLQDETSDDIDLTDEEIEAIRKKGPKVRDHDHWTGHFRGAAHSGCNLLYRKVKKIPLFFHNLSGYDGHIIFENIPKVDFPTEPKLLAKSLEKFISIRFGVLEMKDSLNFLSSSLDSLVKDLKEKSNGNLKEVFQTTYRYFKEHWSHIPEDSFEMLTRKLVYPYEYMDGWNRMNQTYLPSKEEYFSSLSGKHITDAEFNFAQKVWSTFKLQNLGQLHDLYMQSDVALLADIFESFRDNTLTNYGLDPAHYLSAPALSWDAALKHTKIRLELLTDIDMHNLVDGGMFGGLSVIGQQYSRANNPQMKDKWNPNDKQKYIMMFDCTNQYGWAMMQFLPIGGFKWIEWTKGTNEWYDFVMKQTDDQDKGYIFEVDLSYPEYLHDIHDQYPLAPEHMSIKKEMLSRYQQTLGEDLKVTFEGRKLCPTLYDKHKYVCHYRSLKQFLELGLILTKVHRVIEFNQKDWLRPYIELNTELRRKATCKFDENQAKLMNNSFYGKTLEDTRKYKNVRIVTKPEKILKISKNDQFSNFKIYSENLAAVLMRKNTANLNKPRYIGLTVLNLSKLKMNDFHYNYIMRTFPETKLLVTDTDSFCYEISTTEDLYKKIQGHDWFDFSNYPKDHPLYNDKKRLKPGFFKDEFGGQIIEEIVGLRPKMYSIQLTSGRKKATAKGVNKSVRDDLLTHQDYKNSLFNQTVREDKMTRIINKDHKLFTVEIEKKSLSPFDDKRFRDRQGDVFTSYSFGHYMIAAMLMKNCFYE